MTEEKKSNTNKEFGDNWKVISVDAALAAAKAADEANIEAAQPKEEKKRYVNPAFEKYKGKIAEITKNMTPEQRAEARCKRLSTMKLASDLKNMKVDLFREFLRPRAGGPTYNLMVAKLDEIIRNKDRSLGPKDLANLILKMLAFLASTQSGGGGNVLIQNNVGPNKPSEIPKNMYELEGKQNSSDISSPNVISGISISQIGAMSDEQLEAALGKAKEEEDEE